MFQPIMIGVSLLVLCFTAVQATHEPMNNPHLFQGDMVLSPEQQQALHSGDTDKLVFGSKTRGRWPNARVPYQIESSIDSKTRASIMKAIEQYHKHTCLRFSHRRSERSYVSFYRGNGCHSPVGMNSNGPNRISLGPGCDAVGTALHEIGHSMGFFHEQNRPDRNSYIKIHWDNVEAGAEGIYRIAGGVNSLGTAYDYESLMHYCASGFVKKRGLKAMTTLDPSKQHLIDRCGRCCFSEIDIQQLNIMYCGAPPVTQKPPVDGCGDQNAYCGLWAARGACGDPVEGAETRRRCCKSCRNMKKVSCGNHQASSCAACPQGNGAVWCNGDCVWKGGRCASIEPVEKVSCGSHSANTCSECPQGNGASWCNGQCKWDYSNSQCRINWG